MSIAIRGGRQRATIALAAALAWTLAGCGGASAAPPQAGGATRDSARVALASGDVVVVESVTVNAPVALPAQLHVDHDAWIAARAGGVLESLAVDLGSVVGAGATLARVESVDQELALERAQVDRAAAERLVLRARALTHAGGVTAADSDQAELAFQRSTIALAEARRALALTVVTSPFGGTVSARRARPGQLVRAGDTLFRVTQAGPLLARVNVPEALAAGLHPGSPARVIATARGARDAAATVLRLAPAVDAASGTREVVLQVGAGAGLLPGSGVLVRLGAEHRRALVVPRGAVSADGYALVLQEGRPTLRAVLAGEAIDGGRIEVLGGLAAGERVARSAP